MPDYTPGRQMPGYYVEGRYYGNRYAQAVARARFLSVEYGRPIDVDLIDHRGNAERAQTVITRLPVGA